MLKNLLEKKNLQELMKTRKFGLLLEIYLVQVTIQRYAEALPFPLSWAAFFIAAFAGGILVHSLADRLHI